MHTFIIQSLHKKLQNIEKNHQNNWGRVVKLFYNVWKRLQLPIVHDIIELCQMVWNWVKRESGFIENNENRMNFFHNTNYRNPQENNIYNLILPKHAFLFWIFQKTYRTINVFCGNLLNIDRLSLNNIVCLVRYGDQQLLVLYINNMYINYWLVKYRVLMVLDIFEQHTTRQDLNLHLVLA